MANIQTPGVTGLAFRMSVTTGVTSAASVTFSGITAEDVVLGVLELAGAGAGAVTAPNDRTSAVTAVGSGYIQLNVDTSGDHLVILWHNKT